MRLREGDKHTDILMGAASVFASVGYENAKISAIAKESNVASGTVYLYFKTKEEILLTLLERTWSDLLSIAKEIRQGDESRDAKAAALIDRIFDRFADSPNLAVVFVNGQHSLFGSGKTDHLSERARQVLQLSETVQKEGELILAESENCANGFDPHLFRIWFFGGVRNLLIRWAQNPSPEFLETIRVQIRSYVVPVILFGTKGEE